MYIDSYKSNKNVGEDALALATRPTPQTTFRTSFAKVISNDVDNDYFTLVRTGTGQTVNQTAGNLLITGGTTARSETILRSVDTFSGALTLKAKTILSQRNANNNFIVELVDVVGDSLAYTINSATSITVTIPAHTFTAQNIGQFMTVGSFNGTGTFLSGRYAIASISGDDITYTVAGFAVGSGTCSVFGWNFHRLTYNGAVATTMLANCQRDGWSGTDISATINTTATGHIAIYNAENGTVSVSDSLFSSAGTLQATARASKQEETPANNLNLYLQIRALNGSTAPTATTWTIGMISVEDYVPVQVSITSVRPQSSNEALPVRMMQSTSTAVTGTVTANGGTPFTNPVVALTGDTGAKVATGNGATVTNLNAKGAQIVINLGAVTGTLPTCTFKVQGSADSGITWYDIPSANTASLTATGVYGITIFPGITTLAGTTTTGTTTCVSNVMPRTWRLVWTIGGTTPSFTITNVQVSYLL